MSISSLFESTSKMGVDAASTGTAVHSLLHHVPLVVQSFGFSVAIPPLAITLVVLAAVAGYAGYRFYMQRQKNQVQANLHFDAEKRASINKQLDEIASALNQEKELANKLANTNAIPGKPSRKSQRSFWTFSKSAITFCQVALMILGFFAGGPAALVIGLLLAVSWGAQAAIRKQRQLSGEEEQARQRQAIIQRYQQLAAALKTPLPLNDSLPSPAFTTKDYYQIAREGIRGGLLGGGLLFLLPIAMTLLGVAAPPLLILAPIAIVFAALTAVSLAKNKAEVLHEVKQRAYEEAMLLHIEESLPQSAAAQTSKQQNPEQETEKISQESKEAPSVTPPSATKSTFTKVRDKLRLILPKPKKDLVVLQPTCNPVSSPAPLKRPLSRLLFGRVPRHTKPTVAEIEPTQKPSP